MTIIWDRDNQAAGIRFAYGGWLYQLHHNYVVMAHGGPIIVGRYG